VGIINNGISERKKKILVLSDFRQDAEKWTTLLQDNYFAVRIETNLFAAKKNISRWRPDLIVIDLVKSPEDIIWFCRETRNYCSCPILLMIQEYNEEQVLDFLAAGVTDCLLRPVLPAVLFSRIRAWLHSPSLFFTSKLEDLEVGGIILNANENLVILPDDTSVKLTNLEFRLLHLLMSQPGLVYESQRIINYVWGISAKDDTSIVKHVIYRLRKKIEPDSDFPYFIRSIPGRGYFFYDGVEEDVPVFKAL
jgi:two-component system, OmpR family, response regulator MtrA